MERVAAKSPPAPATVPERLTTPPPIAVLVGIVAILPNLDSDSRFELQRAPADLPVGLGPPLRLRI